MQSLKRHKLQRRKISTNGIIFQVLLGNSPALNTTTLRALGRNLRKLIFSYNFVLLLTTITIIIVLFTICLKMCRSLQIKQEIPMKYTHLVSYILTSPPKRNWSCILKLKVLISCLPLRLPGTVRTTIKLLESVAASFSGGENGLSSEIIGIVRFGATYFRNV